MSRPARARRCPLSTVLTVVVMAHVMAGTDTTRIKARAYAAPLTARLIAAAIRGDSKGYNAARAAADSSVYDEACHLLTACLPDVLAAVAARADEH